MMEATEKLEGQVCGRRSLAYRPFRLARSLLGESREFRTS